MWLESIRCSKTMFTHFQTVSTFSLKIQSIFREAYSDENITRAGDEDGELGIIRKRLLRFLEISHSYSPQTVLLQLAPHAFFEERALILGRLKQHDQALALYVNTLKNIPAAEDYCRLYYNSNDETNSQVRRFWDFPVSRFRNGLLEKVVELVWCYGKWSISLESWENADSKYMFSFCPRGLVFKKTRSKFGNIEN